MNSTMMDTRDVILSLKQVKKEKKLSLDGILRMVIENDSTTAISKTTIARVFRPGSENEQFMYETTLRPIANALLDIDNFEPDDDSDTKAYKSLLKLKNDIIQELNANVEVVKNEEKQKYLEMLAEETEKFQRSLTFVKNQVELKDKRIDHLLEENMKLVDANMELLHQFLKCPLKDGECNEA